MREEIERLAFAQALYTQLGRLVSTKDPDSLRAAVDAMYRELYEQTGAKSFEVSINGQKVGTYSVRVSKPKDTETSTSLQFDNLTSLLEWFEREVPQELMEQYVRCQIEDFASWYFETTGEIPYGCSLEQTVTLAQPAKYQGGTLKVEPTAVLQAMGNQLGSTVAGILGGGNE